MSGSNGSARNGVAPHKIRRDLREHAETQESHLAQIIGETVALHLADLLGKLLTMHPAQPACVFCVEAARAAEYEHQRATVIAAHAAEPPPPKLVQPQVNTAVTWMMVTRQAGPAPVACSVPVCYAHIPPPPATPQQTDLVTADGRPIVRAG